MNHELPDVQAGFRKGRGRDQIANIRCIVKNAREFQKTSTSALLTMSKPLTMWITMKSYLATIRDKVLIHAKWMNLENMFINEIC